MHLLAAVGIAAPAELDFSRPLHLGPLELGIEAAVEAAAILHDGDYAKVISCRPRAFDTPAYWSVVHAAEGEAEMFGFPFGATSGFPTAMEIAIVRATAALPPEQHHDLWSGGLEVVIGSERAIEDFRRIATVAERPMAGIATAFACAAQAVVDPEMARRGRNIALDCLANSYRTSPLKFRFLELYRVMEALFLADVKARLLEAFDKEPNAALSEAVEALKSELKQIIRLAEANREPFEECWSVLHDLKNTNQFVAALFRRIKGRTDAEAGRWNNGAALVYQIRCAVVHAGAKDMIYEQFSDADVALEAVLPSVERAALLMVGIRLL